MPQEIRPDGLTANFYFGGGVTVTTLTPLTWGLFVLASALILLLPRRYVIAPFLIVGLLLTMGQQMVLGGVHLQVYRLLILVAWIRLLIRRDPLQRPMGALDKAVVAWALANAVMYSILWGEMGAVTNRLGFLFNVLGLYFLVRYMIRDREDVFRAIKLLSFVSLVISVFMVNEHTTGHNLFSMFGGVAEVSGVRNGGFRAQGPFEHSIVAGTFGAVLLPLFIALWWAGKGSRFYAVCGVASSVAITLSSASSTPVMTLVAGIAGLSMWPLRRRMRVVRWAIVISAIAIQSVMNSSIWFLMARLGGSIGGTGWHRSELIDQFIRHFDEWWMIGTTNNASWGLDMWDAIDAYVNAGVGGGLITLVLFVGVLVCAFKTIGIARQLFEDTWPSEGLIWAMGATLFANTVAFFGIIYYDQSSIVWYCFLAMISALSTFAPEDELAEKDDGCMVVSGPSFMSGELSHTVGE